MYKLRGFSLLSESITFSQACMGQQTSSGPNYMLSEGQWKEIVDE